MKKTWGSEKFSRSFFTVRLFLEHYTVMVYDSNMKLSAAHLILVLFTFTFFLFASCSARGGTPRTEQVLGTVCTINAYTDGTDALYAELFARLTPRRKHIPNFRGWRQDRSRTRSSRWCAERCAISGWMRRASGRPAGIRSAIWSGPAAGSW